MHPFTTRGLTQQMFCKKQFYFAGFPNIQQHNVSLKSIIADNGKLYISNEQYMRTANGIKSSNCMKCCNKSLAAPCVRSNELECRQQMLRSQFLFLF